MQLALRPYVTTGVAIVGASVIAVAPIVPTPTEIQLPNPLAQVDRGVQLTANEIENAVNQVIFLGTQVVTTLAKLPAPIVGQLLGVSTPEAQIFLALGAIGLFGPLISGPGAGGAALQDLVDQLGSGDIVGLINALIGAPATIIDGLVNGNYGPDLASLISDMFPTTFAGGLINPGNILMALPPWTAPGTFPTLQGLVDRLLGLLPGGDMLAATAAPLAVPVESEGAIEGAVNALLFNLVARPIVAVSGLVGSVLTPLIGEEAAALLPVAALGLLGPLISGPGAIGTGLQDVVDSLGKGDLAGVVNSLIGLPATIIDGAVNGGYGPDLGPLISPVPLPFPFQAGGLINQAKLPLLSLPPWKLPGTIPTLQGLVSQIFGLLPGAPALATAAPVVSTMSIDSVDTVDTSNKRLVTLDVAPDLGDDPVGKKAAPDNTPPGPTADLKAGAPTDEKVPPKVDEIKAAIDSTPPGPDLGKKVSEAAKPDAAPGKPGTDTDTLDMTDGGKVIPETTAGDNKPKSGKGGSNPVGTAISSVAKSLAGAVKSALGG